MSVPPSVPDSCHTAIKSLWTRVALEKARDKDRCPTFPSSEWKSLRDSPSSKESSIGYNTGSPSNSSVASSTTASPPTIMTGRGRGRGARFKSDRTPPAPSLTSATTRQPEPIDTYDPYWTVSNLTNSQFYSLTRAPKPDDLGQIGRDIQVIANYFPILQFPHHGLVYRYHIQMRNRKDEEMHRDLRRVLYKSWLRGYCRRNPSLKPSKVVFDNQMTILSFDQPLPDIDQQGAAEMIMGPTRANKQVPYQVTVQQSGDPIDLSLLQQLDQLFAATNESNERLEHLQSVKQVLSIALHEHCSSHAEFIYNRSFFTLPSNDRYGVWDLGQGKALWRGFYSCLVLAKGEHKLLMNLDVKHTVFLKKQPFLDFVYEVMVQSPSGKRKYGRERDVRKVDGGDVLQWLEWGRGNTQADLVFLAKQCKGLRVRSQDAAKPIIYTITRLAAPAFSQTVTLRSAKDRLVTVENYYKQQYNIVLKFPQLPALEMTNGAYLPMELVDTEPARMKKITDDQRAAMCRQATMRPVDYQRSIQQIRRNPEQQGFEDDPFIRAWQMNVDVKMITVPARVLPMPDIIYTNQYQVTNSQARTAGVWESATTNFYEPKNFPSVWAMINLSNLRQAECEEFFMAIKEVAKYRGMNCPPPAVYEELDPRYQSIGQIASSLRRMMERNSDCQFFLVILPIENDIKSTAYGGVKRLCELETGFGITTQMIRPRNCVIGSKRDGGKWDYGKLNNILMKINTKLNGTNSVLRVQTDIERFFAKGHRIMYVGADLSHGSLSASGTTSAVAVVASADDVPNRYFKEVYKQQRSRQVREQSIENIVDMREIMISLIRQYEQYRGFPPHAIVFYRDGISEGEFDSVFEKELTSIREACTELSPTYRPCLTYIVVNKRHHTRFFPTNAIGINVEAGTVIDSHDVTSATTYDFYLNSQHGALGTSRPTHYHVLYDDNKLKPDQMHMLTYALCYTYARCTRSVTMPAPVRYAHLLATRASVYIGSTDESPPQISLDSEESVEISCRTKSDRIVLSSKLSPECPFFV